MNYLDTFCIHVRNMIDIIQTLGQVTRMATDVKNLMRIPMETIINGPSDDDAETTQKKGANDQSGSATLQAPSVAGSSERSFPEEGILLKSP